MTEPVAEALPHCANCDRELSRRGTPDTEGNRYCSDRKPCRRVRDRRAYARRYQDDEEPLETRPCSFCGVRLPARSRRSTDSPVSRACQNSSCQRKHRKQRELIPRLAELYEIGRAAHEKLMVALVVLCPVCDRLDAREGFVHPPAGRTRGDCRGTGEGSLYLDMAIYPPAPGQKPCECKICAPRREASATL